MSALDDLRNKKVNTQVELCILYWGDEVSASDENIEEAEQAAADLAALNARVEKLEKVRAAAQKLINLRGVAHGAWAVEELEAALKGAE